MQDESLAQPPALSQLLWAIAVLGVTSLGGWPAYYHDSFVVHRRWLSDRDYLEGAAISNLVPGPTFTNFTIFAAHKLGGWIAVPLGLILVLLPGAVAMIAVTTVYGSGLASAAGVQLVLNGLSASATALVCVTIARVLRSRVMGRTELAIAAVAFIALGPLGLSLFVVVPPLVVAAVVLEHARRRTR